MPVAKAIAAISVCGAGLVGVYYIATADGASMPGFHFLSEDSDYADKTKASGDGNDYHGKYGATYGNYLVGVVDTKNDLWWKWSFQNRYQPNKEKVKGKFKELSGTNKTFTDLKTLCTETYKTNTETNGNILTTWPTSGGDTNNSKFLESEIWLLCSPYGSMPETAKDEETKEGTLVTDSEKKKTLISTTSTSYANNLFWDLKQKEFSKDNTFKTETKTLKKWCEDAYKKTSSESQITSDNILKWCSLGTSTTSSQPAAQ